MGMENMINKKHHFIKVIVLMAMFACLIHSTAMTKEILNVTFMFSSGNQRSAFLKLLKQFQNENPTIKTVSKEYEQEKYKSWIEKWLNSKNHHSDVMFWFGGVKLQRFVSKGWVESIDELWQQNNWDTIFTKASKSAVTSNQKTYGLPLSYYQWGFYYRKSIFQKYQLQPPTTWKEFLFVCDTLKNNGIVPITLGSKFRWTAAGWFDYFNLRLNGLAFHKDLMNGKIPYTHPKVKEVFRYWKILLDRQFFIKSHNQLDWRRALPPMYHDLAGMVLMGNFIIPQISQRLLYDFDYFRFPQINESMPYYEEAPIDIFFIPHNAKNKKNAKKFLTFMARADVQHDMNQQMGMISPNRTAKTGTDRFINAGAKVLEQAAGISQFYDRDTPPEMFNPGMDAMIQFMKEPEKIDQILESLESVRQKVFHIN